MSALESEQVPIEEAPQPQPDEPPKRGPGRPRKDGLPPGSVPPDRSKGTAKRGRPRKNANLREQMATLVGGANMVIALSPYRDDVLSNEEMDLLTDALTAEAAASERIGGWLGKAAGISPHILLIQAVVKIAVPRMVRHGILPGQTVDPELQQKIREMQAEGYSEADMMREIQNYAENRSESTEAYSPVPMEAR